MKMMKKPLNNIAPYAIGILFTFASQNIGDGENRGETQEYEELSAVLPAPTTNTSKAAATDTTIQSKPEPQYISTEPPDLSFDFEIEQQPRPLNLSISNWDSACLQKPPYLNATCLKTTGYTSPNNGLFPPKAAINDIEYSYDCTETGHNIDNKNPQPPKENVTECLGGIRIKPSDQVTIKINANITRDPEAGIKDKNIGICPEEDLSECVGVNANIELKF